MRAVLAGTAVLCLLAAQPAAAAWQTSAPGPAKAKGGTVVPLTITSCTKGASTAVTWQPVPGASTYTVLWQEGGGVGSPWNRSATTPEVTFSVPESINRVRVQAAVGSWTTTYAQKDCP